ncbi:hypothetical protein H0H93_008320 [Arthromyces matolae]|nr:hypothetical protein H0H93_008320 [Arthromyces matolae]
MIPRFLNSIARTAFFSARHRIVFPHAIRSFSSTQSRAVDNLPAFTEAFQKSTIFRKLANQPEAINAIRSLMETLKESGVDVSSGAQPSTFAMAKLMMNSKFREQIKIMAEAMKKADVDLTSKEVMDELMAIKKAAETPK